MKTATWTEADMSKAIHMIANGAKQVDASEATGVCLSSLAKRLDELECHHPDCTEDHPCRGAKRRKGGVMACMVLENTVFEDVCPFFMTAEEFEENNSGRRYAKGTKHR